MIKILFSLFFIFLSTQAQAYTSSKGAYTIDVPASWQIGDPQKGCHKNSFCFVLNPDESEVVFMEPYQESKLKNPDDTLIQNLLGILIIKGPSNTEQLKDLVKKTFEALIKITDGGIMKNFKVIKYAEYKHKKMKGELFYWEGTWGKMTVDVMQLYISGPNNTLVLSCTYDPVESKKYEKICMESFKTLQFQ